MHDLLLRQTSLPHWDRSVVTAAGYCAHWGDSVLAGCGSQFLLLEAYTKCMAHLDTYTSPHTFAGVALVRNHAHHCAPVCILSSTNMVVDHYTSYSDDINPVVGHVTAPHVTLLKMSCCGQAATASDAEHY